MSAPQTVRARRVRARECPRFGRRCSSGASTASLAAHASKLAACMADNDVNINEEEEEEEEEVEEKAEAQLRAAAHRVCAASHAAPPDGIVRLAAADCTVGESQRTAPDGLAYDTDGWDAGAAQLTPEAEVLGARVFAPLAKRQSLPGRPHDAAMERFLVDRPRALGFFGVGGRDLARLLHLVLVPAFSALAANAGASAGSESALLPCRWVFDLRPAHAPLLREMRDAGLDFLRANEGWFRARYADMHPTADLLGVPLDDWLLPDRVQFGFHSRPSVGYLHLHMLVGPLTDYGASEEYRQRWVPLEAVLRALDSGQPASALLPSSSARRSPIPSL